MLYICTVSLLTQSMQKIVADISKLKMLSAKIVNFIVTYARFAANQDDGDVFNSPDADWLNHVSALLKEGKTFIGVVLHLTTVGIKVEKKQKNCMIPLFLNCEKFAQTQTK